MSVDILIGTAWGDEGKGKFTDYLAKEYAHIVRAQGGPNAGHTLVVENSEYKLHHIPSGILHRHACCYLAAGAIIDPETLLQEITALEKEKIPLLGRFFLSSRCHLILPHHKELDAYYESKRTKEKIGTTKKGIGPCLADKALRIGIRLMDLSNTKALLSLLDASYSIACQTAGTSLSTPPPQLFENLQKAYEKLAQYIAPVEEKLHLALSQKERVLFEGAQGTLLDWQFGTYPFVTSSCTLSSGLLASSGIAPQYCRKVIGVVKAYSSRVGYGPLPTEDSNFADPTKIREVGTTTGRNRRVGWLDLVALKEAVKLNGVTELTLTKIDILDTFAEIFVCTGYARGGKLLQSFPMSQEGFDGITPIYKRLEGWAPSSTFGKQEKDTLPKQALEYIRFIEDFVKCPVRLVSTGPKREHTINMGWVS